MEKIMGCIAHRWSTRNLPKRNQFKAFPVVDLPFFEIEKEREKRLELDLDIVSDEMEARHFSIWVSSFHSMSEN